MPVHTAFLAFFGDDSDDGDGGLEEVAALLGTDPARVSVENEVESLRDAINTTYGNVKDDLDSHQRVPVDAPPRRKAEAIQRAVRDSRRSGDNGDADAVIRAAATARENARPNSMLARRFLDEIADAPSSSRELVDRFETVATRLDEHERAQSALDDLDPGTDVDTVPELVDAYRETDREQRATATDRDRLTDAVESLLDELDVDAEGTLEQRVRTAARTVKSNGSDRENRSGSLDDAVERARSRANPRSRRARRLFDALEDGSEVESALETAASRLDEAATTDALLETVDDEDVSELADRVASDFAATNSPVADALRERAVELGERVERADDSNRVVSFAAHEELSFYEQSLLDGAFESSDAGSSQSLNGRLDALRERRQSVEQEYVDGRSDHNHSIPLYFLSLVDTAIEDAADHLNAGRSDEAAGTIDVAEALLDHVEGLYEQNQYSVMLRSLRG
jgi:hypothetical protein